MHRSRPDRPRKDAGFTIVEVLVALAILAVALALGWQTLAGGTAATRRGGETGRAAALAASLLDAAAGEAPLAAGTSSGREGDLAWRREVRARESGAAPGQRPRVVAWEVRAEVEWHDGAGPRSLSMTTVRIAVVAP